MDEAYVIQAMVKGREACRRIVQVFERARSRPGRAAAGCPDMDGLSQARVVAEGLNRHLKDIPAGVSHRFHFSANSQYAGRLMAEILRLLERALILERETRIALDAGRIQVRADS